MKQQQKIRRIVDSPENILILALLFFFAHLLLVLSRNWLLDMKITRNGLLEFGHAWNGMEISSF